MSSAQTMPVGTYMIASEAIYGDREISRPPNLCYIEGEEGNCYKGRWVVGSPFVNVKFPKATTRKLTEQEINNYHGTPILLGGVMLYTVRTKDCVIPMGAIKVVTENAIYYFGKINKHRVRTVSQDGKPHRFKKCVIHFLALEKHMQFYRAGEPKVLVITKKVLSIEE